MANDQLNFITTTTKNHRFFFVIFSKWFVTFDQPQSMPIRCQFNLVSGMWQITIYSAHPMICIWQWFQKFAALTECLWFESFFLFSQILCIINGIFPRFETIPIWLFHWNHFPFNISFNFRIVFFLLRNAQIKKT